MDYTPLWTFLDVQYNSAARNPLWLDVADMFMAAEDFCIHMQVPDDDIPHRHKKMFSMRQHGFMAQAKYPWMNGDSTTPAVAEVQVNLESILYRFETFLMAQGDRYTCVLNELYRDWLINTNDTYVIFDAEGVPCGRAVTWNEADAICEKQPLYQWDIKKNKKYASLPQMTIADV